MPKFFRVNSYNQSLLIRRYNCEIIIMTDARAQNDNTYDKCRVEYCSIKNKYNSYPVHCARKGGWLLQSQPQMQLEHWRVLCCIGIPTETHFTTSAANTPVPPEDKTDSICLGSIK